MWSSPSETTCQTLFFGSSPDRPWSTYDSRTVSPTRSSPAVRLLLADDHLEQRGLADAVGADDADDAAARQRERQVVDQHPVAEALGQLVGLDHDAAQPRARRDLDLLEVELAGLLGLGGHLLVPLQARLALRLPRLRVAAHPLQLLLEDALPLGVLAPLDLEPGLLGLQVGRVVALVRVGVAAVELEDPLGHVVEEVPVVGDGQDGARVLREVLLQPLDALRVEVVGGLVEQQQVGLPRAAARTARPGAARHRTGSTPARPAAGSAARPSPARSGCRAPSRCGARSSPSARPARPGARRSRRPARPSRRRPPRSAAGPPRVSATASSTLPRTSLVSSSCGSCRRMPTE